MQTISRRQAMKLTASFTAGATLGSTCARAQPASGAAATVFEMARFHRGQLRPRRRFRESRRRDFRSRRRGEQGRQAGSHRPQP